MPELHFRFATPADAARCREIEVAAYEGDEAASLAKITTRIEQYPEGFLIMEKDGKVIGYINSGCAYEVRMSDDAFKELIGHDPAAPNVVIMSVAIDPEHQGRGYAGPLMRAFVKQMQERGKATIHLMCKERHIPLYEHFGYHYQKPSASGLGGMSWHEMRMDL